MKGVVALMSLIALFFLSYISMTLGWGVEVKSWGWVIGSWFGVVFVTLVGKALE